MTAFSTTPARHAAGIAFALALVGLATEATAASGRSQQTTPAPIPNRTIALNRPATVMAPLGRSLLALGGQTGVVLLDVTTGESVGRIATQGPVLALQSAESRDGMAALAVTVGRNSDRMDVEYYEQPMGQFRLSRSWSMDTTDHAVVVVTGGDTLVRIDRSGRESGILIAETKQDTQRIQTDAPLLLVLPTASETQVLAVQNRSVSLVDVEIGKVLDQITVSGYDARDSGEMAGLVAHRLDGAAGAALVFDGYSEVLTMLQATVDGIASVSVSAQISVADKSLPTGSGTPFVAADDEFGYIVVGREGDRVMPVFRRVGSALERAGQLDMNMPVRAATVLPDPASGPDAFAFLSVDGRRLIVAPDLIKYGAKAPNQAERPPLDPNAPPTSDGSVLAVQSALADLGFQVGAIDGIAGPATAAALRAFQFSNNLPVTGTAEAATVAALAAATGAKSAGRDLAPDPSRGVTAGDYTVYLQFAGSMTREEINALIADLRRSGWKVPGSGERLKSAYGLSEVRYGQLSDQLAAEALADALTRADVSDREVSAKRIRMVRPGILEGWISR